MLTGIYFVGGPQSKRRGFSSFAFDDFEVTKSMRMQRFDRRVLGLVKKIKRLYKFKNIILRTLSGSREDCLVIQHMFCIRSYGSILSEGISRKNLWDLKFAI